VGLWRHCEGPHLHTVPHTFTAANPAVPGSFLPNVSINVPFMVSGLGLDLHRVPRRFMLLLFKKNPGSVLLNNVE